MLALDTAKRRWHSQVERRLAHLERTRNWCLAQLASASLFTDDLDPTNPEKQQGRPMSSEALIKLLRKWNRSLLIETHPTNFNQVVVYKMVGGEKRTAVTFAAGVLPEFSIMARQEQLVEKELPTTSEGEEILSIKKIPEKVKQGMRAAINEILNNPTNVYDEESAMALLEQTLADTTYESLVHDKLKQVGRELVRGWRTVLVRLVQQQLVSADTVERLVKSTDRLSWAVKMGRRDDRCLI